MKLRLNIDYADGTTFQDDNLTLDDLNKAGDLLQSIAFERDPDARHKPGSAIRVTRVDLTWEA